MHLRIFTEPQQGADYGRLLTVARAAEELGFDAFFRSDHYLHMGAGGGLPGPTDSWLTLAALAVQTSRIRLGTLVSSATFRYPGPLAIAVAQADEMSDGRVELGLGAGWFETEHAAYGIPFPPTAERFDRLAEQLAVITGLWDVPLGQTFSFDGDYYQVRDSPGLPKPEQRPHPPIVVGGHGANRTPGLAARYAAEFNAPFASVAQTGARYARVREVCQSVGRDPESMIYSAAQTTCCGRDEAELARRAAAIGYDVADLRANQLAGSPAEIVDKIGQFAGHGASRMYLQILDLHDLDHLELLASEVLPQVR
ncbi:MAG TPA: LLM class F420-dependent oxidoreductase [Streptosporangiaceae bacterium]